MLHTQVPPGAGRGWRTGLRRQRRRRARDERGATIVLLALVLVVLMIFAAFSVDIGTAYAQRRQNQGSVDTAAIAGGVYFLYKSSDFEAMIQEVKSRVAQDMGSKIPDAEWAACTDPDALPTPSTALGYAPINGSPCISFDRDPDTNTLRMRVRLPDVSSATSFASVIGIDKLRTHAVAEVNIGSPLGGAFPAYVLSGTKAGTLVCVLNDSMGQSTYCNNTTSGQFGMFAPYYYSSPGCESGNQGGGNPYSLAPAIATGLDHYLGRDLGFDPGNPAANERMNGGGSCTVLGPNTVNGSTGNPKQVRTIGLLIGSTGTPSYTGRLVGGPYAGGAGGTLNSATMAGLSIDNAPLWAFLTNPLPASAPIACKAAASMPVKRDQINIVQVQTSFGLLVGGVPIYATPEALMAGCLGAWTTPVGPIFKNDFAKSHRAVSVPRFWENVLGPASSNYHIRDFVPMFLTGEYQSKAAHWAGDPVAANNSTWNPGNPNLLDGEAAVYVPCGSLPQNICVPTGDPADNGFGGEVHGVTLTG